MQAVPAKSSKSIGLGVLHAWVISCVVFLTYQRLLGVGFYAEDDLSFDLPVRLTIPEYVLRYLGLNITATFLRPVQGLQFWFEYALFGNSPAPYRMVQILIHLGNCLLLYSLVRRVAKNERAGLVAALIYTGLPAMISSFFWISTSYGVLSLFYLLSLALWLRFLEKKRWTYYVLAFAAFVFALLTNEIGVTLPVTLFLAERWLVREDTQGKQLVRRYSPFLVILLIYGLYSIRRLLVFSNEQYGGPYAGFRLGSHMLSNLVYYAAVLVNPWAENLQGNLVWLLGVILFLIYLIVVKRNKPVAFLTAAAVLPLLPVLPLDFAAGRFLYLPLTASAVLIALLLEQARKVLNPWNMAVLFEAAIVGLLVFGNAVADANKFDEIATYARQFRQPVRSIFKQHPKIDGDTFLYFVNSPLGSDWLSGMITLHYGVNVPVGGTDVARPAELRKYKTAYLYYFDENNRSIEQKIEPEIATRIFPTPPIDFDDAIRLEGYEISNQNLKRGQAIALLLYWRALGRIERDYTVFVHLIDSDGRLIVGEDSMPRNGRAPTSTWREGDFVVDAHIIPIGTDIRPGKYRLEVGLYFLATLERLSLLDGNGLKIADKFVIDPFEVVE